MSTVSVQISGDKKGFNLYVNGAPCIEQRTERDGKTPLTISRALALSAEMTAAMDASFAPVPISVHPPIPVLTNSLDA